MKKSFILLTLLVFLCAAVAVGSDITWTAKGTGDAVTTGDYAEIKAGVNSKSVEHWYTATSYTVNEDIVSNDGALYTCTSSHTSSAAGAVGDEPGVGDVWATYWDALPTSSSTALDDLTDPAGSKTVDINNYTFGLQTDTSGKIRLGDISAGNYFEFLDGYAQAVGDYYLRGSQVLTAVDADGEFGGTTAVFTVDSGAAQSLFGQAMHIDSDGELICADDDAAATLPFAGALMTAGTGASKTLLTQGKFCETDFNWTVGGVVYVSGDPTTTLGYTQTVPTTNFGQKVGIATSADCIMLDKGPVVEF